MRIKAHEGIPERESDRDFAIDAAPQVSNSKAELKQRFLIRLKKVGSKTISLVHVVRIRVKDEIPQE